LPRRARDGLVRHDRRAGGQSRRRRVVRTDQPQGAIGMTAAIERDLAAVEETMPTTAGSGGQHPSSNQARTMLRAFTSDRMALLSAVVLLLLVLAAILAPLLAPFDPDHQDFTATFQDPSTSHLLGTDDLGRDLLSRMLYGGRLSLGAAVVAVTVGAVL